MISIRARFTKTALLGLSTLFLSFLLSQTGVAQDGEKLFRANCASCHKITAQKMTGPGLAGVEERWKGNRDNLKAWIKNSKAYMDETGDAYAIALFEEYNQTIMPPQAVTDEEIDAILDYIANPPIVADDPTSPTGSTPNEPTSSGDAWLWLILILLVVFIVTNVLLGVRRSLQRVIREKEGLEPLPERTLIGGWIHWLGENKRITAVLAIVLLGYLSTLGWDQLLGVGVYTEYAPEQPIKFSHQIHAGQNGVSCQYCHHSAEKGKHSGIPSANVCMNCHKGISEGSQYGTEEISKIYAAVGWDPEAQAYTGEEKPIEWIRIHNLPDFAYFNHSQHVVVGKQECQTCHGPVETFDYPMKQYAPLTMGWCINCHRETKVDMKNGYYQDMNADLLEKYSEQGVKDFTVEHIGGLECAKCHY